MTDNPDFIKGEILLFDKPYRWSSFDVVNKVRISIKHYCHQKIKVGHAGTLDPLATGLVILCTGAFTKKIENIQSDIKEYVGTFTLGATRPSFDKETEIDHTYDYSSVTESDIINAAASLTGEQLQVPPAFSAIRVAGVRAYKFARSKDKDIEKKLIPRKITISKFTIDKINLPDVYFTIVCSKGTYIRSLARDFGNKLGCGAYLEELRRTAIGNYRIEDAYDVFQFDEMLNPENNS